MGCPMRTAILASLVAVSCGAIGCGATDPAGGDGVGPGPDHGGTPENPVAHTSGPYAVHTSVDFTIEAILPPQIELVVVTLRSFSKNPARAIFDVAEQKGVPAVGIIRDALPGALEDKLEEWINNEIEKVKINGKPITEYAGEIAALAEIALSEFAVHSELTIDAESDTATHTITALDLTPAGIDFRLPIGGLAGDILTQAPRYAIGDAGALSMSEQHFGLNYGEYAWQGLEMVSTQVFGQGIRATLGKAINCDAIAKTVADKCVLGACVGHEKELEAICVGGLDAVVDFAHDKMAAMRLEALHLITGAATLVDDTGDGLGDRIVDGEWQAELNIGLGLRHAPATFVGAREGARE